MYRKEYPLEDLLFKTQRIQEAMKEIKKEAEIVVEPSKIEDLQEKIDDAISYWIEVVIEIQLYLHLNEEKKIMEQRKKIIIRPTSLNERDSYVTCFVQHEEGILEVSVNDGEVVVFELKNEKGLKNFVYNIMDAWKQSVGEGEK